jgi:hypothetical protein
MNKIQTTLAITALCLPTICTIIAGEPKEQKVLREKSLNAQTLVVQNSPFGGLDQNYILNQDSVIYFKMQCGTRGCLSKYFLLTKNDAQMRINHIKEHLEQPTEYGTTYKLVKGNLPETQ